MLKPEKHLPINVIIINNTNLSTGESKHSFLGSFRCGANFPERSPIAILQDAYTSQYVQDVPSAAAGPQSQHDSLSEDYCLLGREVGNQDICCLYNPHVPLHNEGGVNPYITQTGTTEPVQKRYEEEEDDNVGEKENSEMPLFCNWDGDTGQLQLDFPLLSRFSLETSGTAETQMSGRSALPSCHPVLTSVVVQQASVESADEDPLLKMENEWALQVQSTTE